MPAPLADIDVASFDRGIATNIRGTFLGMKFQIPAMLQSGGGGDREHGVAGRPDLEAAGAEAQRQAALSTPMRRTGSAGEVAQTVLWLCSPQSSFITGT